MLEAAHYPASLVDLHYPRCPVLSLFSGSFPVPGLKTVKAHKLYARAIAILFVLRLAFVVSNSIGILSGLDDGPASRELASPAMIFSITSRLLAAPRVNICR
jgi:hypothetical protein